MIDPTERLVLIRGEVKNFDIAAISQQNNALWGGAFYAVSSGTITIATRYTFLPALKSTI